MNLNTSPPSNQESRYLARLAVVLASVPKPYREDVLDGIQTHIKDSLDRGDADITTILNQLGTPSAVATQAMHDFDEESGRSENPPISTRSRKLQMGAFALALLVVLLGIFLSAPTLTVSILPSSLPPLVLTLIPLLTRRAHWRLISGICAALLAAFLLTAVILSVALGSFAFPLTLFLIPTQTMALFYMPILTLATIPLLVRRP